MIRNARPLRGRCRHLVVTPASHDLRSSLRVIVLNSHESDGIHVKRTTTIDRMSVYLQCAS